MKKSPWVVDIKGGPGQVFEITVLRESNTHGVCSYGWMGEDKILISGSGGPCSNTVPKIVWDRLVLVAHEVAEELNVQEAP